LENQVKTQLFCEIKLRKYIYLIILIAIFAIAACSKAENLPVETPEIPVKAVQEQAAPIAADPLKRGRILYTRCKSCHTLEEGGKHRVGPNLWNIAGAKAGEKDGFAYSTTMSESEVIWTDEALAPEDQASVIEYLKAKTTPQ